MGVTSAVFQIVGKVQTLSEVFTTELIVGRTDRRQSLMTRTRILSLDFPGALLEGIDIIIIKCKHAF